MRDDDQPRWFGWARASSDKQFTSPDRQEADIRRYAQASLAGVPEGRLVTEIQSATKTTWKERPAEVALLSELRRGDHLIVWRLDRLERMPFMMVSLVNDLIDRGVVVHTLADFGGQIIRLDNLIGRVMLWCMAMASDFFIQNHREATIAGMRWRKENGFAVSQPPIGQKIVKVNVDDPRAKGTPLKRYVADEHDCRCIRELIYRHDVCHEPYTEIARDWERRGVKTGRGKPWSHHRGDPGRKGELFTKRMAIARKRALELGEVGGVPVAAILAIPRRRWNDWSEFSAASQAATLPPPKEVKANRESQVYQRLMAAMDGSVASTNGGPSREAP